MEWRPGLIRPEPDIDAFRGKIWEFYRDFGRDLPWRRDPAPYEVFVSEIMLQQTQVGRVLVKYPEFLARFGGFRELAAAPVADVLAVWQGMGYNRRALWLRAAAETVVREFAGELPRDPEVLMKLPGVGVNTAGSMAAFAYEVPSVFIETNIRRVFLHEFFAGREDVTDAELRPLVEEALDREHVRVWYYALMDYGADLAKRVPNPNRRSRHYAVQSNFEGSVRQIRGEVLRLLVDGPKPAAELASAVADMRLEAVLQALEREGFLERTGDMLSIKG